MSKATNAKMHGAAAMILIDDAGNHPRRIPELEKFGSAEGPYDAGIEFVEVKEALIDSWFTASRQESRYRAGRYRQGFASGIVRFPGFDRRGRARSMSSMIVKTVHNVVGICPARGRICDVGRALRPPGDGRAVLAGASR